MYEAIAMTVIGLTIAGFWLKNGNLLLGAGLAWVGFAFLFYNVGTGVGEPFEGNDFLPTFFLMLGGALAIVCFVNAYLMFASGRKPPSIEDEQEAYRKKILKATKRK